MFKIKRKSMKELELTMVVSKLFKEILDEDNIKIEDEKIVKGIEHIQKVYSKKNQRKLKVKADFSRRHKICAYACRFMITHICFIKKYCACYADQALIEIVLRNNFCVQVCSIGGGPGSDLFGLFLYLKDRFTEFEINANILDLFPDWKDIFTKIGKKMDPKEEHLKVSKVQHQKYDFYDTDVSSENHSAIQNADIIFMVKFVSAVISRKIECFQRLQWISRQMKDGAILFCIDNSGGNSLELLESALSSNPRMKRVLPIQRKRFKLPALERSIKLRQLREASLGMTLWKKEEELKEEELDWACAA